MYWRNSSRRRKMKVILLSDVNKVGKKGDVKEVSDGYSRNFLIARGLAVVASDTANKVLEKQNEEKAKMEAELRAKANELKDLLATKTLTFKVKSHEDKIFNSVSTKQIEEALAKQGISVDKRKFVDKEPITTLGTTDVHIELYKDVIGIIKVKLEKE